MLCWGNRCSSDATILVTSKLIIWQTDAHQAERVQVKEDVRAAGLCRLDEDLRCFTLPPARELASLRVVVCTCCAAGLLSQGEYGLWRSPSRQRLTFTHVMIDEAGQVGSSGLLVCVRCGPWRCAWAREGMAAGCDNVSSRCALCTDPEARMPPAIPKLVLHCAAIHTRTCSQASTE